MVGITRSEVIYHLFVKWLAALLAVVTVVCAAEFFCLPFLRVYCQVHASSYPRVRGVRAPSPTQKDTNKDGEKGHNEIPKKSP